MKTVSSGIVLFILSICLHQGFADDGAVASANSADPNVPVMTIIESPHPEETAHARGYAGLYVVEIKNQSLKPIDILAYGLDSRAEELRPDAAWIYNALLVEYAYNPSEPVEWSKAQPPPIKTLPLPDHHTLEKYQSFRLKVPIDVNKDLSLPFKFCARYSPKSRIADFSRGPEIWLDPLVACRVVGGEISKERAIEIATAQVGQPSGFERKFEIVEDTAGAWHVRFSPADPHVRDGEDDIWIDRETGKVLKHESCC